jgi:transposase
MFSNFLDNLAAEYPEHLNVVQLDNGKFHQSSQLKIPDNILLVFQPPYSPELNPSERVWQYIKQELNWGLYDNLDKIK